MVALTYIGIFAFVVLMASMSWTAGTQQSLSSLAKRWRWLLLVALWSQVLILPAMIDVTPDGWRWLAAVGIAGVVFAGATNVWDKADEWVHIIAAVVAFTMMAGWVMVVDSVCLLPLIVCIAAGRERWKWRVEVGLVISVYMASIRGLEVTL